MTADLVARLAQEIRRVDGSHSLGAGALAEALAPFIEREAASALRSSGEAVAWAVRDHSDGELWMVDMDQAHASRQAELNDDTLVPLYTTPPTPASAWRPIAEAALLPRNAVGVSGPCAVLLRIDTGRPGPFVRQGRLTTSPTPSAPVVDDWSVIVEGLRLADQFFDGDGCRWEWDDGEPFPANKVRAAYRAALSGVSAPVGVEALCREAREIQRACYGDATELHLSMIDWARKYDAALTPPAAAPRVEDHSVDANKMVAATEDNATPAAEQPEARGVEGMALMRSLSNWLRTRAKTSWTGEAEYASLMEQYADGVDRMLAAAPRVCGWMRA